MLFIDESHATLPQVRAMYNGDRARKLPLVDYGFRLPCAFDNRPLKFEEFAQRLNQVVYVSATPGSMSAPALGQVVEQVIRPTGLLDPVVVEVRPVTGQIDDLIGEINQRIQQDERVLVTTLTKRMAESLTQIISRLPASGCGICTMTSTPSSGVKSSGTCALGVNLTYWWVSTCCGRGWICRVSLVAILDADKEGFCARRLP